MDSANLAELRRLAAGRAPVPEIRLFRDFDPEAGTDRDVADPYFGTDNAAEFDETVEIARRTSRAFVAARLRDTRI